MSELNKEEREKEFEILLDELIDALDDGPHPHPIPTPEEKQSKNKAFKIILDEYKKTETN